MKNDGSTGAKGVRGSTRDRSNLPFSNASAGNKAVPGPKNDSEVHDGNLQPPGGSAASSGDPWRKDGQGTAVHNPLVYRGTAEDPPGRRLSGGSGGERRGEVPRHGLQPGIIELLPQDEGRMKVSTRWGRHSDPLRPSGRRSSGSLFEGLASCSNGLWQVEKMRPSRGSAFTEFNSQKASLTSLDKWTLPRGESENVQVSLAAGRQWLQQEEAEGKGELDENEMRELSSSQALTPSSQHELHPTSLFFHPMPPTEDLQRIKTIVENFNQLSSDTQRLRILHVFSNQYLQPYERRRSFTADTWDEFKRMGPSDKRCNVGFDQERSCIYVTIFRRRYRVFPWSFLLRAVILILFWACMYVLVSPKAFSPGGLYFDTIATITFAGVIGCFISRLIPIPPLVCVILAGLLYGNIPHTFYLTSGISVTMRTFVNTFGMAVGVIRAGLSMNVKEMKKYFFPYMLFSILPLAAEALVHGCLCKLVYNYPNYTWAMMEGFLVSAVAPSVVAPVLIDLQSKGYGTRDGPGMLILTCVSLEASVCIFVLQILFALEFTTLKFTMAMILLPVQIVGGALGGVLLGCMIFFSLFHVVSAESETIPLGNPSLRRMTLRHMTHVRYMSVILILLFVLACVSVGRYLSCAGGGVFMALVLTITFSYLCLRGESAERLSLRIDMIQSFATMWDYLAMPAMFAFAGAGIDIHEVFRKEYIGQSIGIIFAGLVARFIFAVLTPLISRMGYSWKELLFCGIGYLGKGSLQGALGTAPLVYALLDLAEAVTPEEVTLAEAKMEYARLVKNAAILSTIIACPICSTFLSNFAERLLRPDVENV